MMTTRGHPSFERSVEFGNCVIFRKTQSLAALECFVAGTGVVINANCLFLQVSGHEDSSTALFLWRHGAG
jgi:hypothetical protein